MKPSGTFAAWTYCLPVLNHRQHPAQAVLLELYEGTLGPYWAGPRKHVEVGYRGIEPSDEDFLIVVRRDMETSTVQTVDELVRFQYVAYLLLEAGVIPAAGAAQPAGFSNL